MGLRLDSSIQYLKGVGPQLGGLFERQGIKTIQDLLEFYPRTYEDRRAVRNIASLVPNELVSLKAQIVSVKSFNLGKTRRKIFDVTLKDSSGLIHCKYFRVPYKGYFERFQPGQSVRVVGKVTDYKGRIEFHHPDIKDFHSEEEDQDALIPVYVEIEGLSSFKIHRLIQSAWIQVQEQIVETLPVAVLEKHQLLSKKESLRLIHQPPMDNVGQYLEQSSPAHRRLIFEEFFWLELILASRQSGLKQEKAPIFKNESTFWKTLLASLPFALTQAQQRVMEEILSDLESGKPMYRLVQGDVGSGKTILAFLSAMIAQKNGFQSALMAPTEILAEQHLRNFKKFFPPENVRVELLTGRTKAAARKELQAQLQSGEIDLLIGTHALIEDQVEFKKLGLVIIDEQHRFGVQQRADLKSKGDSPHFLVMTATPIPRTLAMTVYGDLDVSVVDELPPGRSPVQTRVVFENKKNQVWDFVGQQMAKGRQAYVIYPLVEESDKIDLKNATEEYENLKKRFPKLRVDLLHGRMKSEEKDQVMERFRRHEIDILVSTTVIEVGVDVPNANIIVVEQAERFGLSQLHQLRGRVGRGQHKSFCILVHGYAVSEEARLRTEIMEKTNDGFKVAEFDLEFRGPGEFMGTRQSGLAGFKLANIVRDQDLLQKARAAAFTLLREDPKLIRTENEYLKSEILKTHGPKSLAGIA